MERCLRMTCYAAAAARTMLHAPCLGGPSTAGPAARRRRVTQAGGACVPVASRQGAAVQHRGPQPALRVGRTQPRWRPRAVPGASVSRRWRRPAGRGRVVFVSGRARHLPRRAAVRRVLLPGRHPQIWDRVAPGLAARHAEGHHASPALGPGPTPSRALFGRLTLSLLRPASQACASPPRGRGRPMTHGWCSRTGACASQACRAARSPLRRLSQNAEGGANASAKPRGGRAVQLGVAARHAPGVESQHSGSRQTACRAWVGSGFELRLLPALLTGASRPRG